MPAALILNRNLRTVQSKYPLLVAVTDNIIDFVKPYLDKENVLYKVIPFMQYSKEVQQSWGGPASHILNIASKFALFKFYEYDKLVYIDSDIVVYKNIDSLFDYPDGAMYDEHGTPFIGLFVFCPQNHNADYYYALSLMFNVIESVVLEGLFFPAKSNPDYLIPWYYYLNIMTENLDAFLIQDISAVHFCNKFKPWKYRNWEQYLYDFSKEFSWLPNTNRKMIIVDYINNHLLPFLQDYPELECFCK